MCPFSSKKGARDSPNRLFEPITRCFTDPPDRAAARVPHFGKTVFLYTVPKKRYYLIPANLFPYVVSVPN